MEPNYDWSRLHALRFLRRIPSADSETHRQRDQVQLAMISSWHEDQTQSHRRVRPIHRRMPQIALESKLKRARQSLRARVVRRSLYHTAADARDRRKTTTSLGDD